MALNLSYRQIANILIRSMIGVVKKMLYCILIFFLFFQCNCQVTWLNLTIPEWLSKNLIQKKYDFKQIIQPKSNERFYNFLETEATDVLGTKRITTNKLKQRIATEYSKFFSGNTTPQAGGSPLEDLKTSKGSYFSPFAVSLKGLKQIYQRSIRKNLMISLIT